MRWRDLFTIAVACLRFKSLYSDRVNLTKEDVMAELSGDTDVNRVSNRHTLLPYADLQLVTENSGQQEREMESDCWLHGRV